MELRLGRLDDISAVLEIMRRVTLGMQASGNFQWDTHYPNSEVFKRDTDLGQLWVVEIEHRLAGFAAFTTDQELEYSDLDWDTEEAAIVVHRLAVDPLFRGKGVASALMLHAERVAAERGIDVVRVDTNTQNAATLSLFPKLGYRFAGEIGLSFRPGLRFYCYEKRLPQPAESLRRSV